MFLLNFKNAKKWLALTLFSVFMAINFSSIAIAQENITIDQIEGSASSKETDDSREVLFGLLGKFADSPLTASTETDSIIGDMFLIFNTVLFAVGVAFMTYSLVMSIAVSAHEGEVMGKRMSSLWVPIRYGIGIFGMIPAFSGFSLAQAVMMFIAVLGVGLANMMALGAIESASAVNPLNKAPVFANHQPLMTVSPEIAKEVFAINVCSHAVGEYHILLGLLSFPTSVQVDKKGLRVKGASINCGSIDIIDETGMFDSTLRDETSLSGRLGFRNSGVDYETIKATAVKTANERLKSLQSLQAQIAPLATQWYNDHLAGKENNFDLNKLGEIASKIQESETNTINAYIDSLVGSSGEAIKSRAKENMKKGGWTSIGAWFSIFAEANAAYQSAAMASHLSVNPAILDSLNIDDGTKMAMSSLYSQWFVAEEKDGCLIMFDRNATGNCSPAQNMFLWSVDQIIKGTGGTELVNPITATKNIGDWMLTFVGTVTGAALFFDSNIGQSITKRIPLVKDFSKGVVSAVKKDDNSFATSIASLLLSICLILGITFAVYVPFIPFLTWFSALVSYFASVLEGLVAAQVWAFSHLQTEGEGVGQKAEKGYLFILNMLLRPGLMVLGFFFAAGILTLLGTLFFKLFGTALANAQGNTMTGPFVMIGLIAIIGLALLTLIQTIFNLIYEIPDRVISWFGGGMEARIAKEMDQGIERGAKSVAQWTGGTAFGSVLAGRKG